MIDGGASLAPRRWSLPALATHASSRSWCRSTARMTAVQKKRNCSFSWIDLPGSIRFCEGVPNDQFRCFPLPLMRA